MENKTIYLLRHGLATYSKTGYGNKILSAELLPEGIVSSTHIAEYLKNKETDYNVSSEVLRCRQTVAIIEEKTNKHFVFDTRLNEYWPESKEPFETFQERVKSFVLEITTSRYQNILICTHGTVIAGIKNYILSGNFNLSQILDYPLPGSLAILKNGAFEVIDFNK